ncbi:restriction endonuclease subunit S [Limnohabitans sp. T6-5]|uniref:restriction endonuclease subunit S n=1 Tax=Limnohabitans sp. T6-5 TaxID=1100724 RepID=UPI0018EE95D4|nr:restriction endonuclease subunit S [Limnohabitans sp. T6-5]
MTAFRDGQVTLRSNRRTEGFTESIKEIGYQGVRKGDLLVHAMDGFAGAIGVSDSDGKCSPVCSVCVPTDPEQIHVAYFGYLVRQLAVTDFISSLAKGIRERSTEFRYSEFSVLDLALPPQNEQANIAAFLDQETAKIDALIEKQQRLIELLKEKRQAVISHAVTKGLNPNTPMKDSGVEWLGEVPAHWGATYLKYATSMIVDCPHETPVYSDDGEYLVIRTADLNEGHLDSSKMYRVQDDEYIRRVRRADLMCSDIVYGREGERWGHAGLVPEDSRYCLGQRMMQFRVGPDFSPDFLMWLLNSDNVYKQGQLDTVGATSPHVNVSTIRNFSLTKPPLIEQKEIGRFLSEKSRRFDELIDKAVKTISLLQERRTALISAAVTGKIDVRDWQAVAVQEGVGVES